MVSFIVVSFTTWTNTGATRYGRGQHKTGSFGDDMLRPSPNHGTQRLPNDDDDDDYSLGPRAASSRSQRGVQCRTPWCAQ